MPEIYNANLTRTPQFGAYLNQYSATSGRVPSARILDQIIQSELDAASNQMWRNKQLQLQQQQLSEQSRQFNVSKELQEKGQRTGEVQGLMGLGANLYTTKLGLDYLRGATGRATRGATGTSPTVAGPSLWGKTKDMLGFGGTATTPTAAVTPESATGFGGAYGYGGEGFGGMSEGAVPQAGMSGWDYAVPGLAGLGVGALVGRSGTGQDVGRFLMAQHGGQSERGAVSGGLAGGLTGYLTSGGDLWGALTGATLGAVGGSDIIKKVFG